MKSALNSIFREAFTCSPDQQLPPRLNCFTSFLFTSPISSSPPATWNQQWIRYFEKFSLLHLIDSCLPGWTASPPPRSRASWFYILKMTSIGCSWNVQNKLALAQNPEIKWKLNCSGFSVSSRPRTLIAPGWSFWTSAGYWALPGPRLPWHTSCTYELISGRDRPSLSSFH